MLVLARADAGGYPMVRAEVDLDAIVDGCVRELAPRAAAKHIKVTSRVEPLSVVADEALLSRMVGNLLTNALAYTPDGGAVEVVMVNRPGAVSIQVSDTGPGIPHADRERIFERFVRRSGARRGRRGPRPRDLALDRRSPRRPGGIAVEQRGWERVRGDDSRVRKRQRSITSRPNDPAVTGPRPRPFAGGGSNAAFATKMRCVARSSPMFRDPGDVCSV
jgi:hypothetical protein